MCQTQLSSSDSAKPFLITFTQYRGKGFSKNTIEQVSWVLGEYLFTRIVYCCHWYIGILMPESVTQQMWPKLTTNSNNWLMSSPSAQLTDTWLILSLPRSLISGLTVTVTILSCIKMLLWFVNIEFIIKMLAIVVAHSHPWHGPRHTQFTA